MDNIVLERTWKRSGTLYVECIDGNLYTGEEQAHTFRITGQNEQGTATPITGTITGKFLRADNLDVPLTGSLDGGVAVLTLTEQCYDCRGRYVLSIFADDGEHKICIYCGTGNVFRTDGEATIDPSNIIQDVSDLIDRIQTAIGQIPADYSALTARVTQTEADVSDLKSALNTTDLSVMPTVSAFITGVDNIDFSTATSTWSESTKRIGNDTVFNNANDVILNVKSGFRFIVFFFTSAGAYSSNSGWQTSQYIIPAGSYFSLEMSKTDSNANVSTADAANLYEVSVPNTLNKAAFSNAVAQNVELALPYRTYTDITSSLTWATGFYRNGTTTYDSNSDYKTATINAKAGEMYRITGKSNYNCRLYCVFVNGSPVSVFPDASNNTSYSNILVTCPVDCTIYVGKAATDTGTKVESVSKTYRYIWDYIREDGLAGKTWLCMGDSITYNTAATNSGNKNYFELIAERTGVIPTNAGRTGTGYTSDSGGYSKFVTRIAAITDVYDIFTIFGSCNDNEFLKTESVYDPTKIGTVTDTIDSNTYCGYVNAAIDAVYETGNNHLGIISPLPWRGESGGNSGFPMYELSGRGMATALEDICKYRGIPYLDLFRSSNMRPWDEDFRDDYIPDGTHPNQDGYEIFTQRIEEFIKSL